MAWFDNIQLIGGELPAYELKDCVPLFDGKYYAHRGGEILTGLRPLKVEHSLQGYETVRMVVGGKPRRANVHGIICRAFNGPRPSPIHYVLHRDGSRTNNLAENLYWGTARMNAADRWAHRAQAVQAFEALRELVAHIERAGNDPRALALVDRIVAREASV